jgi:hypothetical protein
VPHAESRLETIEFLLDRENAAARGGDWAWAGRVVVEPEATYLLIIADTPDQDREINRRLEAELIEMGAEFSITLPLAIAPAEPQAD